MTPELGVPRAGVVNVGEVANTIFPVPVAPDGVTPPMEMSVPKVWSAVHVFACPSAKEATTAPVVGDIVNVPSEFATEFTAPLPEPQAAPVLLNIPAGLICTQYVPAPSMPLSVGVPLAVKLVTVTLGLPVRPPDVPVILNAPVPVRLVTTPDAGVPSAGVVRVGDVRVNPAIVVVVDPEAIDVLPIVIGKPLLPEQLPAVHAPPAATTQSPFTGARPDGEFVPLLITMYSKAGHVTPLPDPHDPQEGVTPGPPEIGH